VMDRAPRHLARGRERGSRENREGTRGRRATLQVWKVAIPSIWALGGMTEDGDFGRPDRVMAPSPPRVIVCCDACSRTSPPQEGPLERAEPVLRSQGWMWRRDARLLCPMCNARESTLPPPPPSAGAST
jgi:hypothetical protein